MRKTTSLTIHFARCDPKMSTRMLGLLYHELMGKIED